MAEAFGIGAGIVGVISLTIQIAQVVVEFGLDWKDAPHDVKNFMVELQTLQIVLSETNKNLILNQDFAEAFEDRPSLLLSQLGTGAPLETSTKLMLASCQRELENLLSELKKSAKGHRVGWERFKRAFLAKHTKELVENLYRQCQTLNSMVSIDATFLGAITQKEVKEGRKEQQEWHQAEENRKILTWLSQMNFEDKQKDILSKRHPRTGEWFVELEEFQKWRDGDPDTPSILWCPGIPGAGKSVMSSIVINHLQPFFKDKDACIAFVYCDYKDRKNQTPSDLISNLVKQLALQQNALPNEVKELFSKHKEGQSSPSLDEYSKVLSQLSNRFKKSFIIVDALDEHVNDEEEGCPMQIEFLNQLQQLQRQSNATASCRLFFTSRENLSIQGQLAGCARIDIRAMDSDIRLFVRSRISDSKFRFASELQRNADLACVITDKLVQLAQGMFLLPRLHLDRLGNQTSVRNLRNALNHLPSKLDDLYDDAMSRIEGQVDESKQLAMRTLSWISTALRPLRLDELQHALAIETGDSTMGEESIPSESLITSVTAGLITLDTESRTIRLVHFTAEEYFKKKRHIWFHDVERSIAETCLTYLLFDTFEAGFCPTDEEFEARLRSNALYDYAARNWGNHACAASVEVEQLVVDFLESEAKISGSSQAMMASGSYSGYSQNVPRQMTGVHVAAYFGLREAMMALLKNGHDSDSPDSYCRTPLSYAAENGHEAVVKLLLENGAELETKYYGWMPLSCAAMNGHEAVVKLLLEKGAELETKDKDEGQTPLLWAAWYGHEAVVKLLLEKGAELETKDERYGKTPLSYAAWYGHEAVVKLLLEKGAELEAKDKDNGRTPLSYAADYGHEAVVKLLLEKGAELETKYYGWMPLSCAAMNGHEAVVKLLLEKGAELETKDKDEGLTPLLWAARNGHEAVVKLLLEKGAKLETKDKDGETPLLWAVSNGHEAVVKLLLEKGAELETKSNSGQTPLSYAADYGHEAVVKLLLEKGAELETKSNSGQTPLLWAARNGHEAVVKLLLEKGAELETKDKDGQTPLSWAAQNRHEAAVKLLLEKGAKKLQ